MGTCWSGRDLSGFVEGFVLLVIEPTKHRDI